MNDTSNNTSATKRLCDLLAFLFTMVILTYAASGPLSEFVRWFIENTTTGFEDLSRRDQRALIREHWLGGSFRSFEQSFLLPTGMILGLPLLFAFVISYLGVSQTPTWVRWVGATLSALVLVLWIAGLFAVDGGALPSANPVDFVLFPLATVLVLYLTWRMFGTFIVGFCLVWIVYFFVRGQMPVFVKEVVRRFHAASLISGALTSVSGLSQTAPAGCQLRVLPDQRSGFFARAFA
jgi:hypothetical protein